MKVVIGLMFILLFISQSYARPLLSPALVLHEAVNLAKNMSIDPAKIKTGKRKNCPVWRYRIKDRTKVAAATTTESSTPSVAVATPPFGIATTANLLNKSISKIDFVIDFAMPSKANIIAESKVTLTKPTTVAPQSWVTLIKNQPIKTTSSRTTYHQKIWELVLLRFNHYLQSQSQRALGPKIKNH